MGADHLLADACTQHGGGVLLDSGAFTDAGSRYRDLNQDYAVLQPVYSRQELRDRDGTAQQSLVAAVLDGHGMLGEFAAERAGNAVVEAARSALLVQDKLATQDAVLEADSEAAHAVDILHAAFEAGHAAALDLYKDPPRSYCYPSTLRDEKYRLTWVGGLPMYTGSTPQPRLIEFGATCTLAVLRGSLLAIGNAGDSAGVLGRRQGDGTFTGEELTVRHWGLNLDERTRVQAQRNAAVDVMNSDGYLSVASGRWKGYQLSMTRALGHSMLSDFGVIWTPSVRIQRLAPDDCCLILASDGVWDVFGANEAVRVVMDVVDGGGSAAAAAQTLVRQAVRRATDGPEGDADNTTAVVLAFSVSPLSVTTDSGSSGTLANGVCGIGLSGSEGGSTHGGSVYEGSTYGGSAHGGNAYTPELHPIGALRIEMRGRSANASGSASENVAYGGSAHGGTAFGPAARHFDLRRAHLSSSV